VSGFDSVRSYANLVYGRRCALKLVVTSSIGAIMGFLGGLIGRLVLGRAAEEISHNVSENVRHESSGS